jgi:hypothetical protein
MIPVSSLKPRSFLSRLYEAGSFLHGYSGIFVESSVDLPSGGI